MIFFIKYKIFHSVISIIFQRRVCDKTDDRHYECTDGVYVYDPSARKSADHDRDVPDHDGDDQSCDRIYDVDHDSGLGGLLIFIAKKAHPHFIKVFDEYDELNNVVQENVNAARVVKAYVREDHEVEKFGKISGIVFRLFTKAEKIVAWNSPTMQFTMYIVVLAMVLIGRRKVS